jgi:tRNA threonylcarbamoyladenosine biosynthesis protein TsaB
VQIEMIGMDDLLILAIETATRAGSVAVAKGENVLASQVGDSAVSHSANLIEMIEKGLDQAGAKLSDVDLFAVAVGPGSFTGLRIGLATVKALAVCTSRPVAGVSTLAAIAHASHAGGQVVSLLPAGRGEVFAQLYSSGEGTVRALDDAAHLKPRALVEKYGEIPHLSWAGDGAHQQRETLRAWAASKGFEFDEAAAIGPGWKITPEKNGLAASVASLALDEHGEGKSARPEELQAVYVRASDAEINERWQQAKAQ